MKKIFILVTSVLVASISLAQNTNTESVITKLKELAKYKWGIYDDITKSINQYYGQFTFTSSNKIEFLVGCGNQSDYIECTLVTVKPPLLKSKIEKPDIYLKGFSDVTSFGALKIINDKEILADYYLFLSSKKIITCGGDLNRPIKLIRIN